MSDQSLDPLQTVTAVIFRVKHEFGEQHAMHYNLLNTSAWLLQPPRMPYHSSGNFEWS